MAQNFEKKERIVYKLVLTGGPCSGKTTGQARLCTFFENLGWKVYRVPEAATILLGGGIRFPDIPDSQDQELADEFKSCREFLSVEKFQENLLKTIMAMEETYFALADASDRNCLVICDRGTMDASAFISKDSWEKILKTYGWNPVEMRDNRYNHIIHLVSAANGAEAFYTLEDNQCRTEGLELARERDRRAAEAWIGHPYIDVVDNTTDFNTKLQKMIAVVCRRIGIDTGDRLATNSLKLKFLVAVLPSDNAFPPFQDFDVVHDYLITSNPRIQSRLRKRGQNGNWSYLHTQRRCEVNNQVIEVKRQLTHRDYVVFLLGSYCYHELAIYNLTQVKVGLNMLSQRDDTHYTVYKQRRCFLWQDMYFQLDIYKTPCHSRCEGLILLETYSTLKGEALKKRLPPFLDIRKTVTGDPSYSMFNLSLKNDWKVPSKHVPMINGTLPDDITV